jgi:hypothetical protein
VYFSESWLLLTYGSGDEDQKDESCKLARRVQILITCMEENDGVNMMIEFSSVHVEIQGPFFPVQFHFMWIV